MMTGHQLWAVGAGLVCLVACAGSSKKAESADEYGYVDDVEQAPEEETSEGSDDVEQTDLAEEQEEDSTQDPEPEFKPGMSVNDAINAVPQGLPRVNIDPATLSIPLRDPNVYKPCKLAGNQHFTLKVAVWEGRAVGLDLKTQPQNAAVEECIRQQIGQLEWPDPVKSLNTVEYSY